MKNDFLNKIPVIYLIGSGHCGSTLLDMMMNRHPKIIGVGELNNFCTRNEVLEEMICACGEKVKECLFWKKIIADVNAPGGLRVYRNKINFLLGNKKYVFNSKREGFSIRDYLDLSERIYKKILQYSGKKIIFDSSKRVNRATLLSLSERLDILFIYLVRDGRGVMWSYKRKYGGTFSPMSRWLMNNLKAEIFRERNKNKDIVFLRYEDLVNRPEKELKKILTKIGLPFNPKMLEFWDGEHHQLAGNRLRFRRDKKIEEDLSWEQNLLVYDKLIFSIFAGWLNKFYGY